MKFVSIVLFLILPINSAFSENLNKAYFAGGCFLCMEESFEKLEGVKEVISGYSGGTTSNPTYKEVTFGDTGHFEVVEIIYNNNIISYNELLKNFWINIDPFDAFGQFCDKGYSYKSALFSNDQIVIDRFNFYIGKIQENHKQKVETMILPFKNFYVAEEYHQDYYKKNPIRYTYYKYSCGREQRIKQLKINLG